MQGVDDIIIAVNRASTYTLAYGNAGPMDSGLSVNDNTWKHVVWTISTDNTWKLYINGQLYRTDTNKFVPTRMFRTNAWLGKSNGAGDPPYNGVIDDFRIYNTVLDATDVANLFQYIASPATSGNTNISITIKLC